MPARKKTGSTTRKKKTAAKKKVVARKVASKPAAKKKAASAKKTTAKKATARKKVVAKKATAKKKVTAKKTATRKKVAAKKAPAKKAPTKKAPTKKAAAKKAAAKKASRSRKSTLEGPSIKPYEAKRGEDFMSEDQREHFREILTKWKMELMEEVDRTVHHMKDEAANFPDPNDRATQESEFSLELRTRDRERKLIKKIEEALNSVDSGDYGYCESCGIEIGVRRLEARPTATQCIDCKTLDEIREKQMGG
jgi:DnaK suppressor protein